MGYNPPITHPTVKIWANSSPCILTLKLIIMFCNIIISLDSFESKDKEQTYHQATLSDGSSVFLKEEQMKTFKIGQSVGTIVKKYKKDGAWKSSIVLFPITIGS
jgi:hypothetical protein